MTVHSHSRSFAGLLSSLNGSDFYQFTLTTTQVVDLNLQALFGTASVVLLNASGGTLFSATASSTADAAIAENLGAGSYYIDVTGAAASGYVLGVSTGAPAVGTAARDGAGNNPAAARALGMLGATALSFADWVGVRDPDDYYAFSLAGPTVLRLSLAGLAHNAVLYLRNISNQQIGYAYGTPVTGASIVQTLAAGSYYIDVETSGSTSATDTGYNLAVSATALVDSAGNSQATARTLGVIGSTGQRVSGTIGPLNTSDYYGFILAGPCTLSLTLTGLTGSDSFTLVNASGQQLGSGSASTTQNGSVIAQLAAGSYYADVQGGNATAYTLALTTASLPGSAGATSATAQALGTLTTVPVTLSGWVGPIEASGWYSFTLAGTTTVTLQLSAWVGMVGGSAGLSLLDSAATQIASTTAVATGAGSLVRSLAAGHYYVRVTQPSASVSASYTLSLTMDQPVTGTAGGNGAGNTLATALDIGTPGAAGQSFTGWVGPGETDDIYRFTLAAPALVQLGVSGLSAGAMLNLQGGTGQMITSTAGSATANACLNRVLAAGTYYIDVAGTAATGTLLSVATTPVPYAANGTLATAVAVGTLGATAQSFAGAVLSLAADDYYSIALTQPSVITLQLAGLSTGTYVRLLTAAGSVITSAYGSASSDAWLVQAAPAGTYIVDVNDYTGDTNYLLTMSAPLSGDVGGSSTAVACQMGVLAPPSVAPSDFNADGTSDVLLRNASTGAVMEWLMNAGTLSSSLGLLTNPDWTVAGTGDFNGDGTSDILCRNASTGAVVEWLMNNGTLLSNVGLLSNPAWAVVGTGDFNGDGHADILWRDAATGSLVEWQMNGSAAISSTTLLSDPAWTVAGVGDFNDDGKSDMLLRNAATGSVVEWQMNGASVTAEIGLPNDPSCTVVGTGDFNGDGTSDILWRNATTGSVVEWLMNSGTLSSAITLLTDPTVTVAATGDYNADGTTDILLRNPTTGAVTEWLMNNGTLASATTLRTDPSWNVVPNGTVPVHADFTGDGTSDILLRDPTGGGLGDFLMNNGQPTWASIGWVTPSWNVVGVGDFTGDGTSDILFRDPTGGALGDFTMNNNQPSWAPIAWVPPSQQVVGIGDFNGDGTSDILLRDTTGGTLDDFLMHNNQPTWAPIAWVDPNWNVAGVGDFNGDGTSDILLRDTTGGALGEFVMHNNQPTWASIGWVPPRWNVVGIGDFNGDGTSDILFSDPTSGNLGDLLMKNGQPTWAFIGQADPSLQVVGIGDYTGDGTDDILFRNPSSGALTTFLMHNNVPTWAAIGSIGTAWQVTG
jgi:hypothetical protein